MFKTILAVIGAIWLAAAVLPWLFAFLALTLAGIIGA